MKASKQALGAAAMLLVAAGPAAADTAASTMSVSVQVVAPGSLSGAAAGSGRDSRAAPRDQGSAAPPAEAGAAEGEAVQPK